MKRAHFRRLTIFPPRFTIFYEVNCMLYDNILETIGKTPLVKLNSISYDDVNVFGKLEYFNPSGSVKDRAAYNMMRSALSTTLM